MELILVRHGLPERAATTDGSPANPPLSEQGRLQARRLSAWLAAEQIDRVYASPLRRALQTATPLADALALETTIESGVAEFDQQADSYVPMEELKRTDHARFREVVESLRAGLGLGDFHDLVVQTLRRIIRESPGGRVVVFCHAGVINFWAAHVLGCRPSVFFYPQYTSINRFMASRTGLLSVGSLNEAGHLR